MWISNFSQNNSEQQHQFLAKGVHKMLENVSKARRIAIGDQWGDQQSTSWHHGQLLVTNNIQIYKSDVLGLNNITITTSPHSAAYLHTTSAVHSGKIRHLTWTFPKRYLRCPSTAQYSPVQPSTAQYFLVNVQVKWLILPLCTVPIVRCLLSQACLAPSSKLKNHGNFFI